MISCPTALGIFSEIKKHERFCHVACSPIAYISSRWWSLALNPSYLHGKWAATYREWIFICLFLRGWLAQKLLLCSLWKKTFNKCYRVQPKYMAKSYVEENIAALNFLLISGPPYLQKIFIKCLPGIYNLKGNPNNQCILSWIIKIFHYYCRKQYKNIENSPIIEQNLVLSLPFSLFTAACASCRLPQRQNFKHHKLSFVLYILSFSGWKWFSPS